MFAYSQRYLSKRNILLFPLPAGISESEIFIYNFQTGTSNIDSDCCVEIHFIDFNRDLRQRESDDFTHIENELYKLIVQRETAHEQIG